MERLQGPRTGRVVPRHVRVQAGRLVEGEARAEALTLHLSVQTPQRAEVAGPELELREEVFVEPFGVCHGKR